MTLRRLLLLTAVLAVAAGTAAAEAVPPHLSAMTADLVRQLEDRLGASGGSPQEKAALEAARTAFRRGAITSWSPQPVVRDGAAQTLAQSLGLDLNDSKDWLMLDDLLREPDSGKRREKISSILRKKKQDNGDAALNDAVGRFDAARETIIKDMARSHDMRIGETGNVAIEWNPDSNRVEMTVTGRVGDRKNGEEFQTILSGAATPEAVAESDDVRMRVKADEDAVRADSGESLEKLRASIFGAWDGPKGEKWEILKPDGSTPAVKKETTASGNDETDKLRGEIDALKKKKTHVWKNVKSGKTVEQDRFKRLDDSYSYEGETLSPKDAQKLKALEERLAAAEQIAPKTLPVDQHDPLGMKKLTADEAQPVRVTVTQKDGYTYTYRNAYFDGRKIKADRTLTDKRDINDLPDDVIAQLVSSWSPPEWIELEVRPDTQNSSLRLEGTWWRLHVTYSAGAFGMGGNTVGSIHTPYSVPLGMSQAGVKTADGAAKDELL